MSILISLLIIAVVLWLVFSYILPLFPEPIRQVVGIIVGILALIKVLSLVGIGF